MTIYFSTFKGKKIGVELKQNNSREKNSGSLNLKPNQAILVKKSKLLYQLRDSCFRIRH